MDYLIKRGDAQYGPYSLAGLQQYLQSGHLSKDDLARSEGMADWVPLWQVLGSVPVPPQPQAPPAYGAAPGYVGAAAPAYGVPVGAYGAAAPAAQYPAAQYPVAPQGVPVDLPPNMPWWGLLILACLPGLSIVLTVWIFIQAAWAKKLSGKNKALVCLGIGLGLAVLCGICIGVMAAVAKDNDNSAIIGVFALLAFGLFIACVALIIVGYFAIKSAMEEYYNRVENIGLRLSGAMTFFFNVFYFQYHINRIYELKKTNMQVPYGR